MNAKTGIETTKAIKAATKAGKKAPQAPLRLPNRPLRHFPGTNGAAYVRTPFVTYVEKGIELFDDRRGVIIVDGPPGRGKTFTVDAAVHAIAHTPYWLDLTGNTTLFAMFGDLYTAITGRQGEARTTWEMSRHVNELLSSHDCVLVIDEAQWAHPKLLRCVRAIYDRPEANFGLVLIGQNVTKHLKNKEPGLESRTSRTIKAAGINKKRIVQTLSDYHPLFANTDNEVMFELWKGARGAWREWAVILQTARDLKVNPNNGISAQMAKNIAGLIGYPRKATA